jgi:putative MATE family efflux protein
MFSFKKNINLTDSEISKNLFFFALPIILSGCLQLLFNVADLVVCGQFGSKNSVGAISATTSLIYLIITLFLGLGAGVNVAISKAYGAKDKERGERIIGTAMMLALVSSFILTGFGVAFSHTFLTWMGTPADIIDLSTTYMQIYFGAMPSMLFYSFGSALLRGMGDSKRPFYYLTAAGILNYGFNVLFVKVFDMDVAGVAWATFITQGLSAIAVVITLLKYHGFARFHFKNFRFFKDETIEILKVGLPSGIQGAMFSLSNVIVQSSINSFGSYADTGNGAGASIESFVGQLMDGFCQAGVAFVSANYGAKNVKNIKKSVMWSTIYGCLASLVFGGLAIILRRQLVSIYTQDENSLEVGMTRLVILCSTYILYAITDEIANIERGIGYPILPTVVSLIGICGLRILYIYVFFKNVFNISGFEQYHSLEWLYATYPISWAITSLGHVICYSIVSKKAFKKCEEAKLTETKASFQTSVETAENSEN